MWYCLPSLLDATYWQKQPSFMQRLWSSFIGIALFLLCFFSQAQSKEEQFNTYLNQISYSALYGQHEKVISLCQKALSIHPASVEVLNTLGKSYFFTRQYALGAAQFTKSLAANNNQISCYYWRGKCYTELKQYPKAIEDLRKAAEMADRDDDDAAECYLALGDAMCRQNPSSAEAAAALRKAWQKERYTASAAMKNKIIDRYPKSAAVIWPDEHIPTAEEKAHTQEEKEKTEKAFYEKMEAKDAQRKKEDQELENQKRRYGKYYYKPTDSDVKWAEKRGAIMVEEDAETQLNNGNFKAAAQYYHIYYSMDTTRMWGLYGLAKVYFNDSDFKQSIYFINRCLDKKPSANWETNLILQRADAYLQLKDYATCKEQIKPYLNEESYLGSWALMMQGQILRNQNRPKTEYLPWFEKACAAGGDKRRWVIKQREPAIYATLYPNEPNWEPPKQERNLNIKKTTENEPSGKAVKSTGNATSSSGINRNPNVHSFVPCPTCNGGNKVFTTSCTICNGSGIIRYETKTESRQEGAYMRTITKRVPVACGKCDGSGKLVVACSKCAGRGSIMVEN